MSKRENPQFCRPEGVLRKTESWLEPMTGTNDQHIGPKTVFFCCVLLPSSQVAVVP